MSTQFIFTIVLAVCFGFVLYGLIERRGWRKRQKHDYEGVALSMICRDALHRLESGDVEGAKQYLGGMVATYYQSSQRLSELDSLVASERRLIEQQVQSSSVLANAIKKKQSDEKPVA
jgi:hypothetical protein